MLTVETIECYSDFLRLKPFWDDLAGGSGDMDIPFMTFGWFDLWWSQFGAGKRMLVLVLRQDGEPVGIVPFMKDLVWWRGLPVPAITFMANDFSARTGILAYPAYTGDVLTRSMQYLRDTRLGFDLIRLNYLPGSCAAEKLLDGILQESGLKFIKMRGELSPYIPIDGDWAGYLKTRSHNLREKIKRTTNNYARGPQTLALIESAAQTRTAMDKIVEISRHTWKFHERTAIANDPVRIEFYRRYGEYAAARGMLKILILEDRQHPVAFTFEVKHKNTDYFIKTGFDERYSRSSPGIFILSASIREAFESGCTEYDLLGTNEEYKMKFTDLVRPHYKYWVFNNSAYGRLLRTWEYTAVAGLKKFLEQRKPKIPTETPVLTLKRQA